MSLNIILLILLPHISLLFTRQAHSRSCLLTVLRPTYTVDIYAVENAHRGTLQANLGVSNADNFIVCQHNNKEDIESQHYSTLIRGIYRWPVDSPHKQLVIWTVFPSHDVDMVKQEIWLIMSCNHVSCMIVNMSNNGTSAHDDVINWKHFPRHCPFVRGIHRSPVKTRYNTVNILQNTHNRHPIARPQGWTTGCLLWVQISTHVMYISVQYHVKIERDIMGHDLIFKCCSITIFNTTHVSNIYGN